MVDGNVKMRTQAAPGQEKYYAFDWKWLKHSGEGVVEVRAGASSIKRAYRTRDVEWSASRMGIAYAPVESVGLHFGTTQAVGTYTRYLSDVDGTGPQLYLKQRVAVWKSNIGIHVQYQHNREGGTGFVLAGIPESPFVSKAEQKEQKAAGRTAKSRVSSISGTRNPSFKAAQPWETVHVAYHTVQDKWFMLYPSDTYPPQDQRATLSLRAFLGINADAGFGIGTPFTYSFVLPGEPSRLNERAAGSITYDK